MISWKEILFHKCYSRPIKIAFPIIVIEIPGNISRNKLIHFANSAFILQFFVANQLIIVILFPKKPLSYSYMQDLGDLQPRFAHNEFSDFSSERVNLSQPQGDSVPRKVIK